MKETAEAKAKRLMKQRSSARYHIRFVGSMLREKCLEGEIDENAYSWFRARVAMALEALSDKGEFPAPRKPRERKTR